jgi:uncharacterized protein (UPF0548 family)
MFLLRQPDAATVAAFLEQQSQEPLSYTPAGISAGDVVGYRTGYTELLLGRGVQIYTAACEAIAAWAEFDIPWVEIHPRCPPLQPGVTVSVVARHMGFWSMNACRIVEVFRDTPEAPPSGFAYGTLTDHAERGEERFWISLDPATGAVHYRVRAVSQPQATLAKLGGWYATRLQARFRRDSALALRRAVEGIEGH